MDLVLHLVGQWTSKINELALGARSDDTGAAASPYPRIDEPKIPEGMIADGAN